MEVREPFNEKFFNSLNVMLIHHHIYKTNPEFYILHYLSFYFHLHMKNSLVLDSTVKERNKYQMATHEQVEF